MILVDTSVWIAHLSKRPSKGPGLEYKRLLSEQLEIKLNLRQVLSHPLAIAEVAIGWKGSGWDDIHNMFKSLPLVDIAGHDTILAFIQRSKHRLGYVDYQLLYAAEHYPAALWTLDSKLQKAAAACGIDGL